MRAELRTQRGKTEQEVISELRGKVVGQEDALIRLVRGVLLGMARAEATTRVANPLDLPRNSPVMVMGSTASGKTHAVKELARALDAACFFVDCTSLTGAGWAGGDLGDALLPAARFQQSHPGAPCLVVFDECDKLAKGSEGNRGFSATTDMLPLFDGGGYEVRSGNGSAEVRLTLNTDLVVFVMLGAFTGIEDIVGRRLQTGSTCGFTASASTSARALSADELRARATVEDLVSWGFPLELCGRIGRPVSFRALSAAELGEIARRVVTPRFSSVMPRGCMFDIEPAAARLLGEAAAKQGVGARWVHTEISVLAADALSGFQEEPSRCRATIVEREGSLAMRFSEGERIAEGAFDAEVPARSQRFVEELFAAAGENSGTWAFKDEAECLLFPDEFDLVTRPEGIDCVCRTLLRGAVDAFTPEYRLLKFALLYTRAFYRGEKDCPFETLATALELLPLAMRANPGCTRSPLDVMVLGSTEKDGFRGLEEWVSGTELPSETAATAWAAISEYRSLHSASAEVVETAARNVVELVSLSFESVKSAAKLGSALRRLSCHSA